MSIKRHCEMQANELILGACDRQLVAKQLLMSEGQHDTPHSHEWHQLLYPRQGLLRTSTAFKQFHVPSNRAVLIPAHCLHESWAVTRVHFIGIYLKPTLLPSFPDKCKIIEVSPLLRELIFHGVKAFIDSKETVMDKLFLRFFSEQLLAQNKVDLEVVLPTDKRALPIAEELLHQPDSRVLLSERAKTAGASERTISRIFEKETGLTFKQWRQKVRLISSLSLLEKNMPVQSVALSVGYDSTSAFIHSFKKEFGSTPLTYIAQKRRL